MHAKTCSHIDIIDKFFENFNYLNHCRYNDNIFLWTNFLEVREKIKNLGYVYDIHNAYYGMNDIYEDICHVKENSGANEHIIDVMSDITAKKFPIK